MRAVQRQSKSRPSEDVSSAQQVALFASLAISAILMAFAVGSPRHWWLGWITLLPLLQSVRSLAPLHASVAGAFWGASLYFASVALSFTGIVPGFVSLLVLMLVPGLYAGLGAALTRRIGFSPYLLALGWVGVEFCLRPAGFAHGLLSGTQGSGVLVYALGFAGYVVVAFLVAYINASLLEVLHEVKQCLVIPRLIPSAAGGGPSVVLAETSAVSSPWFSLSQPRAPPA